MSNYAVIRRPVNGWAPVVACYLPPEGLAWMRPAEAWRTLTAVLTWFTEDGARRFTEMNGGTVTPFSEVFDHTVILPTSETGD